MASDSRSTTGSVGETAALDAYRNLGYRLVARNWRCRLGELDLIVTRGGTLVFCEVKTRRGSGFGGGYEAVTWRKRAKIRSLAEAFLQELGGRPNAIRPNAIRPNAIRPNAIRFDVASVALGPRGPHVELFEDAF